MKKKIITLLLTFFVIVLCAYMFWFYIAKKHEKLLLDSFSQTLDIDIKNLNFKTTGFPYRFFTEIRNISFGISNTQYNIMTPSTNILTMAYNLRQAIILIDNPVIKRTFSNSFYIKAEESKVSLSGISIPKTFKLISETKRINLIGANEIKIANIDRAIVALRERSKDELELYINLDTIRLGDYSNDFIHFNRAIDSQLILNGSFHYKLFPQQSEKLNFERNPIIIETINFISEFLKLNCDLKLYLNVKKIYTKKQEKCFLQISPNIFNLVETNNPDIENFISLIKTFVSLKLLTKPENFIEIPFFISVKNNIVFINKKKVFKLNF